jgi:hypothetical protein
MMKLKYFLMMCGLLSMVSCEEEVEKPDISITTESSTYQVGQPVTFKIDGYADMISFYSGEPTNDYVYKEGRVIDISDGNVSLTFTSGVTGGAQADQLTFYASTDFDGNYDNVASLEAATWIDITDRFTYGTSATFVSSTLQDITDLVVPGKPIYFAFKYLTRPQATNGLSRTWMIQTFTLRSSVLFNGAALTITDQANAGFRIIDPEPENAPVRSTITTTRVSLLGNIYKDPADPIYDPENPIYDPENPIYDPTSHLYDPNAVRPEFIPYDPASPYNDPELEHWAVTKPIYIDEIDMGPDWSRAVKGIANAEVEEFQHTYTQPGTYTAYVVAVNATIDEREEVVREFTLTINP